MKRDARGLVLAVAAAFAAGLLAIAEHAEKVEQGYLLAAARAEGEVLGREAMHAERRVALLRLPKVASERALAMKLELGHPSDRRTLSPEQVAELVGPPPPVRDTSSDAPNASAAQLSAYFEALYAGRSAPMSATKSATYSSPPARLPRPGEMSR